MLQVGICGICGKMGKTVLKVILEKGHKLQAAFENDSCPDIGKDAGSLINGDNFNVTINQINKKYELGVLDYIKKNYPDIYSSTQIAFKEVEAVWESVFNKELSVRHFRVALRNWQNILNRCCDLYLQSNVQ